MLSLQHDRLKATCQNEYWDPWQPPDSANPDPVLFLYPKMLFFLTIAQQYALPSRSKQFSSMKYEARQISLFYVADAFFDLVMHHVEKVELLALSMQPPLATNVWFLSL